MKAIGLFTKEKDKYFSQKKKEIIFGIKKFILKGGDVLKINETKPFPSPGV